MIQDSEGHRGGPGGPESSEPPLMTRRRFMSIGAIIAVASVGRGGWSALARFGADSDPADGLPNAGETDNLPILDPQVNIRALPGRNGEAEHLLQHHGTPEATSLTKEEMLLLYAPVFTLVHTASSRDSLTNAPRESLAAIARRYYAPELVENGLALEALMAANPSASYDSSLNPGDKLRIPISEPAVAQRGNRTIEEVAKAFGFSPRTLQQLNPVDQDFVYLPIHGVPTLKTDEGLHIVSGANNSYELIAGEQGYDLSTLVGRNYPSDLEPGHIIIASSQTPPDSPAVNPETTPADSAPPAQDPAPEADTLAAAEARVEALKAQRQWHGEIVRDNKGEADALEQQITQEQINGINLTPEGYKTFVDSINRNFVSAFEEAGTVGEGLITPELYIVHHTAQEYKGGIEHFIQSMKNNGLSVQWAMDREGRGHQFTHDPWRVCNHARPHNPISAGVEALTDATRAQGSLNLKQIKGLLYLSLYNLLVVFERGIESLDSVVVGHREINDDTGQGTGGKPDFFGSVMKDAFRPKLRELAQQLESHPKILKKQREEWERTKREIRKQ